MRIPALLLAVLVAGCWHPPGDETGTTTDAATSGPVRFDGAAAMALVEEIVYLPDGSLRPRVPGSGHDETAQWLADHLDLPGWTVNVESFPGHQYFDTPSAAADPWRTSCPASQRDRVMDLSFHNVVADWQPQARGDTPTLILGAHWDAKRHAETASGQDLDVPVPAANDGASGVAMLIVLAEHVAAGDLAPPFGLRIVLFDGEDGFEDCHPLAGSVVHASHTDADRMLLLDMVGDPDARFVRESHSVSSDPDLVDLLWEHGEAALPDSFTRIQRDVADDHRPFIEAGVPSVDLIDFGRSDGRFGFPPYWHTTEDTPDKLSADMLGAVGQVVWDVLEDPRFVAEWP